MHTFQASAFNINIFDQLENRHVGQLMLYSCIDRDCKGVILVIRVRRQSILWAPPNSPPGFLSTVLPPFATFRVCIHGPGIWSLGFAYNSMGKSLVLGGALRCPPPPPPPPPPENPYEPPPRLCCPVSQVGYGPPAKDLSKQYMDQP